MRSIGCRSSGVVAAVLAGGLFVAAAMGEADAPAAGRPGGQGPAGGAPEAESQGSKPLSGDVLIGRMVEHYLRIYGKHLESPDWIARAMAVISLARIDDPRTTEKLFEVMEENKFPIVRVYAWEALHARIGLLNDEQKKRWLAGGLALSRENHIRGDLRIGLVGLVGAAGPTEENLKFVSHLFAHTNSLDPCDMRTLEAMQNVVAAWRSPKLTRALIVAMGDLNKAYRAEYLLWGLPVPVPRASASMYLGSQAMWEKTQKAWSQWFTQAALTPARPEELTPYEGTSSLMPAAEKIRDPKDPRWRKDLELGRLTLEQLDVGFVVDSTGSMTAAVEWIQRDVMKMMRAFALISREPRIGVTFYRDHGDQYVVRRTPLTGRSRALAQAIQSVTAKGGGDLPEAVYEGLAATVKKHRWNRGKAVQKVIVLVGDAPPHSHTMDRIRQIVAAAVEDRFRFYCVKVRTAYGASSLESFDQIAAWGAGKAITTDFGVGMVSAEPPRRGPPKPSYEHVRIAGFSQTGGPYRQILSEVMKGIVAEAYHDRTDPFVKVLLECTEQSVPERRQGFRPSPPPKPGAGGGGGRQGGQPPRPPYDPQAR